MTSGRNQDPRILIGIVALALALFLIRSLSNLIPAVTADASRSWVAYPITVATCLSICALALLRVRCTRAALRQRVTFALVPADEYDPDPQAVERFASQLSRVDRRVRGWLDRPASSIRVRLEPDDQGRLVYLIEVPSWARELVRAAVRTVPGVELRDPATVRASVAPPEPGEVVRAELVMARPSVEPLARLTLDPDPLQAVAAAIGVLRSDEGEAATVCIDLLPAATLRRARLRRRLEGEARRLRSRQVALRQLLGREGNGTSKSEPVELAERRAEGRALDNKLKDGGPLFEVQILVRCLAADRPRAKAALRGLLASFEPMADRNWLRVSGLPIPGLAFLGSDIPGRRRRFDQRIASGRFRPARRGIVSGREFIAWLKPPTERCAAENVLRSGALLPPPPPLRRFDGERDLIPVGRVSAEDGDRIVGVPVADTFFSYVVGRSRWGKTELAVTQFLHLVRSGEGGLFLDPHDALARIKPYLTAPGIRERVIELNLSDTDAADRQPAWNVLGVAGADAEDRVEAVVDAFASTLRWSEINSRALNLTTQAAQALASISAVLPAELAPTIFQLPTLLSNDRFRQAALPFLSKPAQQFWLDRFPKLSPEAITPLTNLVDRLRASSPITALLGQSQSTYSIRDAMDRGQIVLACPGRGGSRDRLIANLIVFDLLYSARGRANIEPDKRRPFHVVLDEVQTYDGAANGNLAGLLEQTAKYGVRCCLCNQNPERLTAETLNAITTNRSHLFATATNSRAATLIAREWGGRPDPSALTGLPRYRFIGQVTHGGGEVSDPFALGGVQAEDLFGPGRPDEVGDLEAQIDETAGRRPLADAAADLDTLDERIVTALELLRGGDGDGEAARRGEFQVGGAA